MEKILDNATVEAIKAEKEEKRAVPWFTNPPIGYENYSYNPPFPSPLPSPLDQTQNSLFTSFEGDHTFSAPPPFWYSQMLEGHDMKSFYMMRQGLMNQAKSPEMQSSSQSIIESMNASAGSMMGSPGSMNASMNASMNSMGGSASGLQSPPVTPYLNENLNTLGI